MKTRLLIIIGISMFAFLLASTHEDSHALLVSKDPVGDRDVIVVGTIMSATPKIDTLNSIVETGYVASIEEIIKGWDMLDGGNNTKSVYFESPGAVNYNGTSYPVYDKIFDIGDRALLMLDQRDGILHESLWSRTTESGCSGNEIIQLNDTPGGLFIYQNGKDRSPFYTDQPFTVQYSFFNKNLTEHTLNVTINVIDDFPEIYHSESFVLSLDECQAYATAETEFVIDKPGSISIHTVVDGETSHGISGLDVVEHILPPLKQIKSGITIYEMQCKEGLQLAIKKFNKTPVCIKETNVEKLFMRDYISDIIRIGLPHSLPDLEIKNEN